MKGVYKSIFLCFLGAFALEASASTFIWRDESPEGKKWFNLVRLKVVGSGFRWGRMLQVGKAEQNVKINTGGVPVTIDVYFRHPGGSEQHVGHFVDVSSNHRLGVVTCVTNEKRATCGRPTE